MSRRIVIFPLIVALLSAYTPQPVDFNATAFGIIVAQATVRVAIILTP